MRAWRSTSAPIPAPCYLEPSEVEAILAQPDRTSIEGQRDHALLSFLYNTGARIQKALDVCPSAIRFDAPACVHLFGKGRKEPSVHFGQKRSFTQGTSQTAAARG